MSLTPGAPMMMPTAPAVAGLGSASAGPFLPKEAVDAAIPPASPRRTRVCLWVIGVGLANLLAFSVSTLALGGDAFNGTVRTDPASPDAPADYFLGREGELIPVARGVWVYSAVHSVSVWLTHAAVLAAALQLARRPLEAQLAGRRLSARLLVWGLTAVAAAGSLSAAGVFLRTFLRAALTSEG